MDHVVSESIMQPRFNLFLLGLFSTVAMLLSAAGIYGVTAYTVSQRTHELGIRLALGAQVSDVLKMILGQGMAVIGVGLVLGLAAAFALMRLLRSLLFGVGENDPLTFAAITLVLLTVALIACYIPARRATKVDPLPIADLKDLRLCGRRCDAIGNQQSAIGNNHGFLNQRHPLRSPQSREAPGVHGCGCYHHRSRHWSEHRDLQCHQCRVAAAVALRRSVAIDQFQIEPIGARSR
jgi:hypothetical protein